ncbi:hypothetical protein ACFVH6_30760 [Spirillospora sp. NPDC127200]
MGHVVLGGDDLDRGARLFDPPFKVFEFRLAASQQRTEAGYRIDDPDRLPVATRLFNERQVSKSVEGLTDVRHGAAEMFRDRLGVPVRMLYQHSIYQLCCHVKTKGLKHMRSRISNLHHLDSQVFPHTSQDLV